MNPTYEIWLCTDTGIRIRPLMDEVNQFSYVKVANGIGSFAIKLVGDFRKEFLYPDRQIQFWRGYDKEISLDFFGLIRNWQFITTAEGLRYTTIAGVDQNDLLARRIVAYAADTTNTTASSEPIDNLMKRIVRYNLGSSAVTLRQFPYLTVEADASDGPTISRGFAWRNVYKVLQDLNKASRESGEEVFFEIRLSHINYDQTPAMKFTTAIGQPRADRSWTTGKNSAVVFGDFWDNLGDSKLEYEYRGEANYAYVGGQGQGTDRAIREIYDTTAQYASVFNRIEVFKDARNTEGAGAALDFAGSEILSEKRSRIRFKAQVLNTPHTRYGREWFWGDRVTASFRDIQLHPVVRAINVKVDSSGKETIDAKLEADI